MSLFIPSINSNLFGYPQVDNIGTILDSHLTVNTSGGVAENSLVENRQDTAASSLANGGANSREVIGISDGRRG